MRIISASIHYLLLALIALYVITGFGITQSRIVTQLTFGLLDKPTAFQWHDALFIPFAVLLVLHLALTYWRKVRRKRLHQSTQE